MEGSCLGVQKHSRHIDDPILPVVTDNDGEPLDVPLMILDEARVGLESRIAFPTVESRNVDQQPDSSALLDQWVDPQREALEVGFRQFLRRDDFQRAWRHRLGLNHAASSCQPLCAGISTDDPRRDKTSQCENTP